MLIDKDVFGFLSIGFGVLQYAPYFVTILNGKTRPHIFSWLIWTITDVTSFGIQMTHGSGPGAWATAFNALGSTAVVCLSFRSGEKNITRGDWISFILSLIAILLWCFTKHPLLTLMLNIFIDYSACYPTLRKSYSKPWEENMTSYAMAGLRSVASLFAIENFSVITAISPACLVALNGMVVFIVLYRRRVLEKA